MGISRNTYITSFTSHDATGRTKVRGNSIVITMGNTGIGSTGTLRRRVDGCHPNSGMRIAMSHGNDAGAFGIRLHGTRNDATMIGKTTSDTRILKTTFDTLAGRRGHRLNMDCNVRIANLLGNGLGSTNVGGNFVVVIMGSRGVSSPRRLRGVISGILGKGRSSHCVMMGNFCPGKHAGMCTVSLTRWWGGIVFILFNKGVIGNLWLTKYEIRPTGSIGGGGVVFTP